MFKKNWEIRVLHMATMDYFSMTRKAPQYITKFMAMEDLRALEKARRKLGMHGAHFKYVLVDLRTGKQHYV